MSTAHMPAEAGQATPEAQKCEGPGHHPQADANRNTTDADDSAQAAHAAQQAEALRRKRIDTLTACLALKGFELRQLAGGGWLITRWNLTKEAADLESVEVFAKQVGAA